MNNENKDAMIASIEKVQAVEEFLSEWWSVSQLYETMAKVGATIISLVKHHQISEAELEDLNELLQQHNLILDIIKPFERKEGEV